MLHSRVHGLMMMRPHITPLRDKMFLLSSLAQCLWLLARDTKRRKHLVADRECLDHVISVTSGVLDAYLDGPSHTPYGEALYSGLCAICLLVHTPYALQHCDILDYVSFLYAVLHSACVKQLDRSLHAVLGGVERDDPPRAIEEELAGIRLILSMGMQILNTLHCVAASKHAREEVSHPEYFTILLSALELNPQARLTACLKHKLTPELTLSLCGVMSAAGRYVRLAAIVIFGTPWPSTEVRQTSFAHACIQLLDQCNWTPVSASLYYMIKLYQRSGQQEMIEPMISAIKELVVRLETFVHHSIARWPLDGTSSAFLRHRHVLDKLMSMSLQRGGVRGGGGKRAHVIHPESPRLLLEIPASSPARPGSPVQ